MDLDKSIETEVAADADPASVYRRFLDALNAQDLAAAERCVDVAEYRENCVGFTPGWVDWSAARASLEPIWKAIPDLEVELHDLAVGPDVALARGTVGGTAMGRLYGAPATKKQYRASFFDWVRLQDGLIVERVQQADVLGQMRQLYGRAFGVIGVSAMLLRQKPVPTKAAPR
jgi:predicted ester cyclase